MSISVALFLCSMSLSSSLKIQAETSADPQSPNGQWNDYWRPEGWTCEEHPDYTGKECGAATFNRGRGGYASRDANYEASSGTIAGCYRLCMSFGEAQRQTNAVYITYRQGGKGTMWMNQGAGIPGTGGCMCCRNSVTTALDTSRESPMMRCFEGTGGASGAGDPHMMNVHGQRFDIKRAGYAPLLKIPSDAQHLRVMGLIEGAKKCSKHTFISRVNLTGDWLEMKNVAVNIGDIHDVYSFAVTVDGKQVWAPGVDQKSSVPSDAPNLVYNHENNKFSIRELSSREIKGNEPGVQIHLASNSDLEIKVTHPMVKPSAKPHLNLHIKGLKSVVSVGGLLGTEDHSDWSSTSPECMSFDKSSVQGDSDGSTVEAFW